MPDLVGLTHKIKDMLFPTLSRNKEIVYWVCELVAALIMLIFLFSVKTADFLDSNGKKLSIYAPPDAEYLKKRAEKVLELTKDGDAKGLFLYTQNPFHAHPTHILNNEYAWIALFYVLKHLLFFVDSIIMMRQKVCKWYDLIGPLVNFIMWLTAMLIGFLYQTIQIYGGLGVRRAKDDYERSKGNPLAEPMFKLVYEGTKAKMKEITKIDHIWIGLLLIGVINLVLWIVGLIQKRSSYLTNQAASTWVIPFSLMLFSLFLEGKTLKTNDYSKLKKPILASKMDEFEARYIFPLIYFAAYLGLLFAFVCIFLAIKAIKVCKLSMTKWILWFVLWVVAFVWVLCIDTLIFDSNRTTYLLGAQITLLIGMVCGIAIAVISLMLHKKTGAPVAPATPREY